MTQFRLLPLGSSNIISPGNTLILLYSLPLSLSPTPKPTRTFKADYFVLLHFSTTHTVFSPWERMSRDEQAQLVGATRIIKAESSQARQKECLQRNFAVSRRRKSPAPVSAPPTTSSNIISPMRIKRAPLSPAFSNRNGAASQPHWSS